MLMPSSRARFWSDRMQSAEARHAADARVLTLSGTRAWQVAVLGGSLTLIFAGYALYAAFSQTSLDGTRALGIDFRVFWAAGQLALTDEPLAVFDLQRLGAVHNVGPDDWMPWLYPPGFLVLMLPFGALSFSLAFLLWTLLSLLAVWLAARQFTAGAGPATLAMTVAPAYLPTLAIGQVSLLWLAGLLVALAALRSQNWVLAGIFIGCLTLKPQLGLLIPIALVAAGCWRTIAAATITALLLAALPTLLTGPEYWPMLGAQMLAMGDRAMHFIATVDLMVGPFFLLVTLGLPPDVALWLQWALTVALAVVVFHIWRAPTISFDTKAAALLSAILLSAPYFWHYEAAMTAAIGLFLLRAGLLHRTVPHMALLTLLWFGSSLQALSVLSGLGSHLALGAALVTTMLVWALALCLGQYFSGRRAKTGVA
jgi:arabinofuranan 3-O-arabinosyltransferase